jgi:hypothetical protein
MRLRFLVFKHKDSGAALLWRNTNRGGRRRSQVSEASSLLGALDLIHTNKIYRENKVILLIANFGRELITVVKSNKLPLVDVIDAFERKWDLHRISHQWFNIQIHITNMLGNDLLQSCSLVGVFIEGMIMKLGKLQTGFICKQSRNNSPKLQSHAIVDHLGARNISLDWPMTRKSTVHMKRPSLT